MSDPCCPNFENNNSKAVQWCEPALDDFLVDDSHTWALVCVRARKTRLVLVSLCLLPQSGVQEGITAHHSFMVKPRIRALLANIANVAYVDVRRRLAQDWQRAPPLLYVMYTPVTWAQVMKRQPRTKVGIGLILDDRGYSCVYG